MSHKKRPHSSSSESKKPAKVPLAPPKPSKTPAPDEQADGSPKPTDTNADKSRNGGQQKADVTKKDSAAQASLRTYSIPDMRLEKPDFRIFMSGEGSSVEYRIEGDLSAAAPRIRESTQALRRGEEGVSPGCRTAARVGFDPHANRGDCRGAAEAAGRGPRGVIESDDNPHGNAEEIEAAAHGRGEPADRRDSRSTGCRPLDARQDGTGGGGISSGVGHRSRFGRFAL